MLNLPGGFRKIYEGQYRMAKPGKKPRKQGNTIATQHALVQPKSKYNAPAGLDHVLDPKKYSVIGMTARRNEIQAVIRPLVDELMVIEAMLANIDHLEAEADLLVIRFKNGEAAGPKKPQLTAKAASAKKAKK